MQLAKLCAVSDRTIRDWRREKFTISLGATKIIEHKLNYSIPDDIKYLDDFWYGLKGAKKGGLRHIELYGSPGTLEGRIKGGHISQVNRKAHPELYPRCNLTKNIFVSEKDQHLAELVGIILGDGGLTHDQLKVTLNKRDESEYIKFVEKLLTKIFKEKPHLYQYKNKNVNVCNLALSGVKLIEFLESVGVFSGNKVLRQVNVPDWIINNNVYSVACLRGLIDTDGGIYYHKHSVNGKVYDNLGLTFTNHSRPLVLFVHRTLVGLGFSAKLVPDGVYLYRQNEVVKYAQIVKFHNFHHEIRLKTFLNRKGVRVV